MGFPGGSGVNNQPAMQESQETQVPSLGPENPLEEGVATTPVFLPGESHGQVCGQQSMVTKSQTWLKNLAHVPWYGFAFVYTDVLFCWDDEGRGECYWFCSFSTLASRLWFHINLSC